MHLESAKTKKNIKILHISVQLLQEGNWNCRLAKFWRRPINVGEASFQLRKNCY